MLQCKCSINTCQKERSQMLTASANRFHRFNPLLSSLVLLFLVFAFASCSTDPSAKRQKFIAQGDQSFAKENYPEAVIYYSRALQVDKASAEAHYKLAKCYIKQKTWANAYQELSKAVELQ